jgi:hypothetical protein
MVGDLPVKPLLGWLGMNMDDKEEGDNDDIVAGSIGEDEREDEALSVEA